MDDKLLIILNIVLMTALIFVGVQFYQVTNEQGYFSRVPTDKIHTMQVWEDGAFVIEYQDNTSEVGCLPEGNCND